MAKTKPLWRKLKEEGRVLPDDLHELFQAFSPPVNVREIAEQLGVSVHGVPEPGWSGAVDVYDDHAVIWLDLKDPIERKNFTTAHELGHLMLHDERRAYRDVTFDGSPQETQANQFAVDLLMPFWMVEPYVSRAAQSDEGLEAVAALFGVSKRAMHRRVLEALGNDVGSL